MPRVSIKDIAREADVSHSTVSRALGDSPLVSAETRERIRRLASEMGYSPDALARSLVVGRTLTIGVVVTAITDPFIAEFVQRIENQAQDLGYSVILASSSSEPEREIAAVEMLHSKRVDAVIVISSRIGGMYGELLDRLGVPVVLVNSHSEQTGPYTFSVSMDNRHGGSLATQHLIELGHRRIAYIAGPADHSDDLERMAGYRDVLRTARLSYDGSLVVRGNGTATGGETAFRALLSLQHRPSAVFCYNDITAIGVLSAARREGMAVPEELAVVGFDDVALASYVSPSLTTVAQPLERMGRQAWQMVLDLLEDDGPANVADVVVRGRLVVRESSARPAAGDNTAQR